MNGADPGAIQNLQILEEYSLTDKSVFLSNCASKLWSVPAVVDFQDLDSFARPAKSEQVSFNLDTEDVS
jgi:hypothetical protein